MKIDVNNLLWRGRTNSQSSGGTTPSTPNMPSPSPMEIDGQLSARSDGVNSLAGKIGNIGIAAQEPGLAQYQAAFNTLIENLSKSIVQRNRGKKVPNNMQLKTDVLSPVNLADGSGNPFNGSSTFRQIIPQNGSGTYSVLYGN